MSRNFMLAIVPVLVTAVTGCASGGLTIDAAQRLENGGDPQGALTQYEQAIKEKPTLVTGYLGRGRCLLKMNQPKDAEQAFRDAVKADGHSIDAKVELAKVLEARKDYMETEINLNDAYMLEPKNLAVVTGLAQVAEDQGKNKEAVAKYKEALALDPNNIDIHTKLAHTYGILNDFDSAKKELAIVEQIKLTPAVKK